MVSTYIIIFAHPKLVWKKGNKKGSKDTKEERILCLTKVIIYWFNGLNIYNYFCTSKVSLEKGK